MKGEKIPDADILPVRIRYQEQGMKNIAVKFAVNVIPGSSITSMLTAF